METYRGEWPTETFPPKMHFLEDHVVPFIQKWKVGFGFYGEQGKNLKTPYLLSKDPQIFPCKIMLKVACSQCFLLLFQLPVPFQISFLYTGGESIHHEFESISSHFVGMEANPVGRLCQTLKRHHVKTHPEVKKHLPIKGSRKKNVVEHEK